MSTIQQTFGFDNVVPWTSSKAIPLQNPAPGLLYGLELEVEGARNDWKTVGMTVKEDGSLRNNGLEFITKPMTYSNLGYLLEYFFKRNPITADNYSERCSVHVHINALDMTEDEIAAFCLVYQVFERVLFNWIGHGRDKNIFCVPWYDTLMTYRVVDRIINKDNYVLRGWQKYTALNLTPLTTQGTMEFRHMEGTHDVARILTWVRLIGYMYTFARTLGLEKTKSNFIDLNTTSQYMATLEQVFQQDAPVLRTPGFEEKIEDGVLRMKYTLMDNGQAKKRDLNEILRMAQEQLVRQRENDIRERPTPDVNRWFIQPQPAQVNVPQQRGTIIIDDYIERELP
jgi:hypothetical protein